MRMALAKTTFFGLVILALLGLRCLQIFSYPADDWDTSSFVPMMSGAYGPPSLWFETAHPGLLSVWMYGGNLLLRLWDVPPMHVWGALMCLGLLAAAAMMYSLATILGATRRMALFGVVLYLASPATADICARSEENLLLHPLYLAALYATVRYLKVGGWKALGLASLAAAVLSAQHLQPFLILSGALWLSLVSSYFWREHPESRPAQLKLAVTVLSAGLLQYVGTMRVLGGGVHNYPMSFYSIVNNDSLVQYLKSFLLFLQVYCVSGNFAVQKGVVGVALVAGALVWVFSNRRLIDWVALCALLFVFVYEPLSSERWDTFVMAVVLAFVTLKTRDEYKGKAALRRLAPIGITALLCFNLTAVPQQFRQVVTHERQKSARAEALPGSKVVLADFAGARALTHKLPPAIRVENVSEAALRPGRVLYDPDNKRLERWHRQWEFARIPGLADFYSVSRAQPNGGNLFR